ARASLELAEFLAEDQKRRVLIVDAGFGENLLSRQFQVASTPGFLNMLNGTQEQTTSLAVGTGHPQVFFLPGGETSQGVTQLLMSERLHERIAEMKQHYDYVLLTCPSLIEDSASLAFPSVVDCVLVLVVPGTTRLSEAETCRKTLEHCKARKVGLILASR
ncbi:MAG: AAA family ATPase, partial [Candidatus Hydrogenedentes bacterium]|nr:AAA family ATPase [Candidatus Hydrogenedentota bacterium]